MDAETKHWVYLRQTRGSRRNNFSKASSLPVQRARLLGERIENINDKCSS